MKDGMIELDGRTGEGGGQLVRIAVGLAALTGRGIRVHHVRGNRPGRKGKMGGGLKAQHASCITQLATFTRATTTGVSIGSSEFTFVPHSPPTALFTTLNPAAPSPRPIVIEASSAASILLVFQAVFPFLLFASSATSPTSPLESGGKAALPEPIKLTIRGGTHVSYSLSYDYIDQVLLPSLETLFGVPHVTRKCLARGWSTGAPAIGEIEFTFTPLAPSQSLSASAWPAERDLAPGEVARIDVTILAPSDLRVPLQQAVREQLEVCFPGVEAVVLGCEESGHAGRVYVLLVAHTETETGVEWRFGRDCLWDKKTKGREVVGLAKDVARKVVRELRAEVRKGGVVDEWLADQLVVFQALAKGRSWAFDDGVDGPGVGGERDRKTDGKSDGSRKVGSGDVNGKDDELPEDEDVFERTHEPFGNGSLHARSAKWVVSQLLPGVKWLKRGKICEGVGWRVEAGGESGGERGRNAESEDKERKAAKEENGGAARAISRRDNGDRGLNGRANIPGLEKQLENSAIKNSDSK